ncbi:MAG TPA: hypothetical protein VMT10_12545 [Solirubrobacteraceae bacterium]|nr:hypothetical protein [Solirubrobacteraceae bacterium]
MSEHKLHSAALALAAALAALAGAAPAAPAAASTTYAVSGRQTIVDENAGTSLMRGDLRGAWKTTSFTEIAKEPIYQAKGTEAFKGCLDRGRDGSCAGDPSGRLEFSFLYWGSFDASDNLNWGACYHPITGGSGDFAGATGALVFTDTPNGKDVLTRYIGTLTLDRGHNARAHRSAARAARTAGCGAH